MTAKVRLGAGGWAAVTTRVTARFGTAACGLAAALGGRTTTCKLTPCGFPTSDRITRFQNFTVRF